MTTYESGPLSGLTLEQATPVIEQVKQAGIRPVFGDAVSYNAWVDAILAARRDLGVARKGRPPKPRQ